MDRRFRSPNTSRQCRKLVQRAFIRPERAFHRRWRENQGLTRKYDAGQLVQDLTDGSGRMLVVEVCVDYYVVAFTIDYLESVHGHSRHALPRCICFPLED